MKLLLRATFFNTLAIFVIAYYLPGVSYASLSSLLFTALLLAIANAVLKPFFKLLIMPFNVITFGLVGWLVHVLILWLVDYFSAGFAIEAMTLQLAGTSIHLSIFWSYVVTTLLLNAVTTIIMGILD